MKSLICLLVFFYLSGPPKAGDLPKYGEVKPLPQGCIYMAFIKPKDDKHCRRSQDGKIKFVVTPTDRVEEIYDAQSPSQFDKQVEQYSSTAEASSRGIPGIAAWQYVKKYLEPSDEIRTFGFLDIGFVVIRNNRIFCLVVTDHRL